MTLLGAVLAGGASRRMGTDKADVEISGSTLLDRVTSAVAEVTDRVVVLGGRARGLLRPGPTRPRLRAAGRVGDRPEPHDRGPCPRGRGRQRIRPGRTLAHLASVSPTCPWCRSITAGCVRSLVPCTHARSPVRHWRRRSQVVRFRTLLDRVSFSR